MTKNYLEYLEQETSRISTLLEDSDYLANEEDIEPSFELKVRINEIGLGE